MGTRVCPEGCPAGTALPAQLCREDCIPTASGSEPLMAEQRLGRDWEGVWKKAEDRGKVAVLESVG